MTLPQKWSAWRNMSWMNAGSDQHAIKAVKQECRIRRSQRSGSTPTWPSLSQGRAGWRTVECYDHHAKRSSPMQRDLD
jgi:hypothetical protein